MVNGISSIRKAPSTNARLNHFLSPYYGNYPLSSVNTSSLVSLRSPNESLIRGEFGDWSFMVDSPELRARTGLRRSIDGIYEKFMYENEENDLFYSLINQVLSDPINDRLALYIPIDIIKTGAYNKPTPEQKEFKRLYVEAWTRLLDEIDPKADFIDGDLPDAESESRDFELVSQACYLVPFLHRQGLIAAEQAEFEDPILRRCVRDAWTKKYLLNSQPQARFEFDSFRSIVKQLVWDDTQYDLTLSDKRIDWLIWERRRKMVDAIGRWVGQSIHQFVDLPDFHTFNKDETDTMLSSVGYALEHAWRHNEDCYEFDGLLKLFSPFLDDHRQTDKFRSIICRLNDIGALTEDQADGFGVRIPNLDHELSSNIDSIQRQQMVEIVQDPELEDFIYPVIISYGSKLKGYGGPNSDHDIAVFVKPSMTDQFCMSNLLKVRDLLRRKFGQDVTQYWIEERSGELKVMLHEQTYSDLGHPMDVHVLLNGAWDGRKQTINMLGERLIKPYYDETNEGLRRVYLRQMERDLLQYRLLHRGYEVVRVPESDWIFASPDYRRTATRLFLNSVML